MLTECPKPAQIKRDADNGLVDSIVGIETQDGYAALVVYSRGNAAYIGTSRGLNRRRIFRSLETLWKVVRRVGINQLTVKHQGHNCEY